jgi:DNA-binding Xre family transcriptional regulator
MAVILRIDKLLAERKMTKRQLAQNANVSEGTLASIYRQIAKGVSMSTIARIAKGFDMTMSEFVNDDMFSEIVL